MPHQQINVEVTTPAPAAAVYALLREGATWPRWSPLGSFAMERPGHPESEGLGAVRVFCTGRVTTREEVVELVDDRRFSYRMLSGLPLRDYRSDIDLLPTDDGTIITWHSAFDAKIPGTGRLLRRALGQFIERCARGLAAEAGRDHTSAKRSTATPDDDRSTAALSSPVVRSGPNSDGELAG